MRWYLALLIAVVGLTIVPVEASAFRYTHRVEISGEITDKWTTTDPASCGANGSGSLKFSFSTRTFKRIRPFISKYGGRPRSSKYGVWTLGVPGGGGVTHMGWRNADATITTVDDTTPGPNTEDPPEPCPPADKTDCGTKSLTGVKTRVAGWDKRYVYSALSFPGGSFSNVTGCRTAGLQSWTFPHAVAGGINVYSDLLVKMPSARKLRKQRTVVIRADDHKVSSSKRSENGTETFTDDVTRKITVTFTKL